jgi:hypothetical protein
MATKTYEYQREYVRKDGTVTIMTVKQLYTPRKRVRTPDPLTDVVIEQYKRHRSGVQIAKMLQISVPRVTKIIKSHPDIALYDITKCLNMS